MSAASGFVLIATAGANVFLYQDNGRAPGTTYYYRVRAQRNNSYSAYSNVESATTAASSDLTAPSIPTGVKPVTISCSQINLSWSASTDSGGSGLRGYNVYRNGSFRAQVLAPATALADAGLAPSTIYVYTVRAVDNAGNQSAQSAGASANTTSCATPTALATATWTPTATRTPTTTGSNAGLVGFIPGVQLAQDVVVNAAAGLAYVASPEFGLSVVNVASPSQPVVLGAANVPFYGQRVAVSGTLAAVSAGGQGLWIVDVSVPSSPLTLGTLPGTIVGVARAGQYAYALQVIPGNPAHTDLVSVNLGNPAAPLIAGRVTLAGGGDIKVAGALAYVAAGAAGLQIVNLANPAAPVIVSTLDTPGMAKAVAVAGSYAYVADTTSVQIVNVSTPSSPVRVGTLPTSSSLAVAAVNTQVYVIDYTSLKIVNVSNPAAPAVVSTQNARSAHRLVVSGSVAYLATPQVDAGTKSAGLQIWNVATPTAPQVLATVYSAYDNAGVAVSGTLAVVAAPNNLGLKVVDVSVPARPRLLGTVGGTMVGVAAAGSYAYALQVVPGNPAHTDLVSVNLSTPSAPVIAGRVTLAGGADIKVVGALAYVAVGAAGLQIVNVANPAAPVIVGALDTPGMAKGVAVAGSYAYVADTTSVQVINVSTPSAPVRVGTLTTTAALAVGVAGTTLYVIDGSTQFKTVNVANPAAPQLLSTSNSYAAQRLSMVGTQAVLVTPTLTHATAGGGVYVVDVANALQPLLRKYIKVPGTTRSVAATSTLVYAGDTAALLDVVDPR